MRYRYAIYERIMESLLREPVILKLYIIVTVQVVDTCNIISGRRQSKGHVVAYESCSSCNENAHEFVSMVGVRL